MRIDPSSLIAAQADRAPAHPRSTPQKESDAGFQPLSFRNTPEVSKPAANANPAPVQRLGANLDIKI
jgi:hypothetical protein